MTDHEALLASEVERMQTTIDSLRGALAMAVAKVLVLRSALATETANANAYAHERDNLKAAWLAVGECIDGFDNSAMTRHVYAESAGQFGLPCPFTTSGDE